MTATVGTDEDWEAHGNRLWAYDDDAQTFVLRMHGGRVTEPSWRYLQDRDDARDVYAAECERLDMGRTTAVEGDQGGGGGSDFSVEEQHRLTAAFGLEDFHAGDSRGFGVWEEKHERTVDLSWEQGRRKDLDQEAGRIIRAGIPAEDLPDPALVEQAKLGFEYALRELADWSRERGMTKEEFYTVCRALGLPEQRPRELDPNPKSAAALRMRKMRAARKEQE